MLAGLVVWTMPAPYKKIRLLTSIWTDLLQQMVRQVVEKEVAAAKPAAPVMPGNITFDGMSSIPRLNSPKHIH
jgi:hypothetical protein